ncbi:MAG: ABC transporter transmembrane domain-containing protein [Waltera sp.]
MHCPFMYYTMEAKKGGADLQKALYSKCMRLPYSYYEQTGSSEFMSKVINDCERAQGIYGSRFRRVLMPFLMMSFYLTAMLMLSWQVTLCLFGASAILLCDKRLVYRTHAKSQLGNVHHQCIHCGTNFQYFVRHRAD